VVRIADCSIIFLGHHQMSIEKSLVSSGKSLYQEDFYGWLQETANLLKEHRFEKLDLENLIEEIETMGRSEKRELESRLTIIAEHLLKLTYWLTEKETNAQGWRSTVVEQRRQVQSLLKESPSLRRLIPEIWIDCYLAAREDTFRKYQLAADLFPIEPPFTLEEILDYDYLP